MARNTSCPKDAKLSMAIRWTRFPSRHRLRLRKRSCSSSVSRTRVPRRRTNFARWTWSPRASIEAAREAGIKHFVYVSVAQPASMMKEYIAVRAEGERMLRESGMNVTILRPWYVLGPGRRWPLLLKPVYWLMARFPSTRDSARRLGLVTLEQMIGALVRAVENPAQGIRIVEVPEIRGEATH